MRFIIEKMLGTDAAERVCKNYSSPLALLNDIQDVTFNRNDQDLWNLAVAIHGTRDLLLAATKRAGPVLNSPSLVKEYLVTALHGKKDEVFMVLFLDSQNRLIEAQEMFVGTVTQTAVYPRSIVRKALEINASALVLSHQHPSGVNSPSNADRVITDTLAVTLKSLEIRVLDHIIVAGSGQTFSFAENGMI